MTLVRTKADVLSALKMKSALVNKGIDVLGMIVKKEEASVGIPLEILEDMTQMRVVGFLD